MNVAILKYFISLGANVNVKNNKKWTPLHEAVKYKSNVEFVKLLLSENADVNAKNDIHWTPLHIAVVSHSDVEILKCLVLHGADVNAVTDQRWTPLHLAADHNCSAKIVEYLISQGADLKAKNFGSQIPLAIAKTEEMKKILRDAANINETEKNTASQQAASIPVAVTSEPIEVAELREQYNKTVEQAKSLYREALEKELVEVRKSGELNLVLPLEAELKHHNSEHGSKPTDFKPDKRFLLTAKTKYKNQLQAALDAYQKALESLAKKLVDKGREDEALIVNNILDRLAREDVKEVPPTEENAIKDTKVADSPTPFILKTNPQKYRVRVSLALTTVGKRPDILVAELPLPQTNEYQTIKHVAASPGNVLSYPENGEKYLACRAVGAECPMPGMTATVFHEFEVTLYDITIDLSKIEKIYPYDKNSILYRRYTEASGTFVDPSHVEIQRIATGLAKESKDPLEFARKAYVYVSESYKYLYPGTGLHTLETILKNGGGDCGNLSSIFISLLRNRGIPARHLMAVRPDGTYHAGQNFISKNTDGFQ